MARQWMLWMAALAVVGGLILMLPVIPPENARSEIEEDTRLTERERQTLASLERIDDHPLYVMTYYGDYSGNIALIPSSESRPAWACSLFATPGETESVLYGRNFDWPHNPALILFTDPPGGYASVSMVDLSYLLSPGLGDRLDQLSIDERAFLLETPFWTFDGMNDQGLAIGMAAVAETTMPHDPSLRTVSSLGFMREVLDRTATVDEALALLEQVNIDMTGGPCLHYLIADAGGESALIEFWDGATTILRTHGVWSAMTNYRLSLLSEEDQEGVCARFDRIREVLDAGDGASTYGTAMQLLDDVHQEYPEHPEFGTQWSIVYGLETGTIHLAMEHRYGEAISLQLPMARGE